MGKPIDSIKKQEWKTLVEDWETSGQSIARWCRDRKISDTTFAYWKKKFSKQPLSFSNAFKEISEEESTAVELEYAGGKFFLSKNFDEDVFANCLKVLRRISC